MSNYRRLISYIYAYEGGVKGKNIGYAKVEVRSGQCRIYVNVKKVYVGRNDIGVYLLTPAAEIFLGRIFIRGGGGEFRITVAADKVDGKDVALDQCYGLTIHDAESSWQSYTTIWEDAVAQAAEIELAEVTAENVRKQNGKMSGSQNGAGAYSEQTYEFPVSREIEQELEREETLLQTAAPAGCALQELEKKTEAPSDVWAGTDGRTDEKAKEGTGEENSEGRNVGARREPGKGAGEETGREPREGACKEKIREPREEACKETERESGKGAGEENRREPREGACKETERESGEGAGERTGRESGEGACKETEREPGEWRDREIRGEARTGTKEESGEESDGEMDEEADKWTPETVQDTELGRMPKRMSERLPERITEGPPEMAAEIKSVIGTEPSAKRIKKMAQKKEKLAVNETQEGHPAVPDPEDPAKLAELDRQEQERIRPNQFWNRMQQRYARVLAFDYDKGCEILSIKPQDIGLLPREIWVYGNNSFLLHGYYNYRHLILAKLDNPQGEPRYLLGVPGHYFSNEKYMATMFGFPHFVIARKQPDGDGRFGYWYTDIRL